VKIKIIAAQREIHSLDWRLYSGFPLNLPADVDLQAGI
jgi:hypothetical protein